MNAQDRPRLIESAFPLKQTSLDSVREKHGPRGYISGFHLWPARRPLAASCTALIATLLPDPGNAEERELHDAADEEIAVQIARACEEARSALVCDVSTLALATRAGLGEHPGFDLHSRHTDDIERCIEVKGRAGIGHVDITENE